MEQLLLLGAGVVALAVAAPIIGSLVNPELGQTIADSSRNLLKEGIKLSLEATEKVQSSVAEASESWNDLVAEAKAEKASTNNARPVQSIEIASE